MKIFEIVCLLFWFAGFFVGAELRLLFWSIPAGAFAGTTIAEIIFKIK